MINTILDINAEKGPFRHDTDPKKGLLDTLFFIYVIFTINLVDTFAYKYVLCNECLNIISMWKIF